MPRFEVPVPQTPQPVGARPAESAGPAESVRASGEVERAARLARLSPARVGPAGLLLLQRTVGNRAVGELLRGAGALPRGRVQRAAKEDGELFAAVTADDAVAVGRAADAGANLEALNAEGATPLMQAAAGNRATAMAELLRRGASVAAADADGWTALHYGIAGNAHAALPLLLAAGASLSAATARGETALAVASRGNPATKQLLLAHAARAGHVPTPAEMEHVAGALYGNEVLFTPAVKALFRDAFLAVVGKAGNFGASEVDPEEMGRQLRDYVGMIYDAVATEATSRAAELPTEADQRMARAAVNDLTRLKADAATELADSPANALKWLGHLTGQEDSVEVRGQRVPMGGWSPGQALFFKCVSIAELLQSVMFRRDETEYLRDELRQDVAAFARAVELSIVEKLFVPMGIPGPVAARLGGLYAEVAATSREFRIPSGSRLHTTYLTTTSTDESHVELAHHNLGRGGDRHVSPAKRRYYPMLVQGIEKGKLAPVFEETILKLVVSDANTTRVMDELYAVLLKEGKALTSREELGARFEPMLMQIANNCSLENLKSVEMETGRRRLGESYARFAESFTVMQVEMAHRMVAEQADKPTADDLVGPRRFGAQLRAATLQGEADLVNRVLSTHWDIRRKVVNLADGDGATALHLAAAEGSTAIVKRLLIADADADVRDQNARTPLHYAAENGHTAIVKVLLDIGADFRATERYGRPAVVLGRTHPAVMALLLAKYPRRKIKGYVFTPHEVAFFDRPGGKKLGNLLSDETFHVIGEDTGLLWVIYFDGEHYVPGYISGEKVVSA